MRYSLIASEYGSKIHTSQAGTANHEGNEAMFNLSQLWVKCLKASKREITKAAKKCGYNVVSSGRTTEGSYVYHIESTSEAPDFERLKFLVADAGAFQTSWKYSRYDD